MPFASLANPTINFMIKSPVSSFKHILLFDLYFQEKLFQRVKRDLDMVYMVRLNMVYKHACYKLLF